MIKSVWWCPFTPKMDISSALQQTLPLIDHLVLTGMWIEWRRDAEVKVYRQSKLAKLCRLLNRQFGRLLVAHSVVYYISAYK